MPAPAQIARRPIDSPTIGRNGYQGFLNGKREVLPKGWNGFNSMPLPCDILAEHDVPVKVRDGCTLYMDIYRSPTTGPNEKVPAIISWSPFGKKLNGIKFLEMMTPYDVGVKPGRLSGLEKFEGPDPAQYVPRGFAIINADARGVGDSEGMCVIMGSQEGEDGYDVIEAIAKMDWCNGNVGLAGNSHLAIVQWFIAQLQPPSLKAIAPWEGCGDLFREQFLRGGIFDGDFFDHISGVMIQGHDGMENFREMARRHPLANPYWNDKRPDMTKIKIPSYITGSFSSGLHTMGSIRGFLQIDCPEKWLRICPYQEWYDIWEDENSVDELGRFFDRYLKGIDNGWAKTPRVRVCTLPFGDKDARGNIVVEDFPIPSTDYREMFFGDQGSLDDKVPAKSCFLTYDSEKPASKCTFRHTFQKPANLVGLPKAVVYMSCDDLDDMDIYVTVRKVDANGKVLLGITVPWSSIPPNTIHEIPKDKQTGILMYMGPLGMLRASHREIDSSKSMHPNWPFHPHEREQKIPPGEIVEVNIGITAIGYSFEAGESVEVWVCGQTPQIHPFNELEGKKGYSLNKGTHKLHYGPEYPSRVILPFVDI